MSMSTSGLGAWVFPAYEGQCLGRTISSLQCPQLFLSEASTGTFDTYCSECSLLLCVCVLCVRVHVHACDFLWDQW